MACLFLRNRAHDVVCPRWVAAWVLVITRSVAGGCGWMLAESRSRLDNGSGCPESLGHRAKVRRPGLAERRPRAAGVVNPDARDA
jgi:hypothetical protein